MNVDNVGKHRTVGQRGAHVAVGYLLAATIDPRLVQRPIDRLRQRPAARGGAMNSLPGACEGEVAMTATRCARPVPGGKGGRFVQKEQLRIAARRHDLPLAAIEGERTGDPVLVRVSLEDILPVVMENASVPHQVTAIRNRVKMAKRINAILQVHKAFQSATAPNCANASG